MARRYDPVDGVALAVEGPVSIDTDALLAVAAVVTRAGDAVDGLARTLEALATEMEQLACRARALQAGIDEPSGMLESLAARAGALGAALAGEVTRVRAIESAHADFAASLKDASATYTDVEDTQGALWGVVSLLSPVALVRPVWALTRGVAVGVESISGYDVPFVDASDAASVARDVESAFTPVTLGARVWGGDGLSTGSVAWISRIFAGLADRLAFGWSTPAIAVSPRGTCPAESAVPYQSAASAVGLGDRLLVEALAVPLGPLALATRYALPGPDSRGHVACAPRPAVNRGAPTPLDGHALVDQLAGASTGPNALRILQHRTGARTSWTVVVPGTETWTLNGANPFDMATNLRENGGLASSQEIAVAQAMSQVGVSPGDAVEFVGHSQGAAVVASLASDPLFTRKYHVTSALVLGGNTGRIRPRGSARVLAVENNADIVPALDGIDGPGRARALTTVRADVDRAHVAALAGGNNHGTDVYAHILDVADASGDPDIQEWNAQRRASLGLTEDTVTTSMDFDLMRVSGTR